MNKYTFEIIKPVVEKNIIFIYFINMAAAKRRRCDTERGHRVVNLILIGQQTI